MTGCSEAPHTTATDDVAPVAWRYEVRQDDSRQLAISAAFDATTATLVTLDSRALAFVHDVALEDGAPWRTLARHGMGWPVPAGRAFRLRYRFDLPAAARAIDNSETAIAAGDVIVAPPSTWLLHPETTTTDARLQIHVVPAAGATFVTGLHPADGERADTFVADADEVNTLTFAAFGSLHTDTIRAGDGTLQVAIAPHGLVLDDAAVMAWVTAASHAIASYYLGHPPAERALVLVMQGDAPSTDGVTLGQGGPATLIRVGRTVETAPTPQDWVITHELLHVQFVDVGPQHAWLSEGLATYLEPIARARVGWIGPERVWRGLLDGLPQGLPERGDQGLERTHTWGRTYWGGALFCLLADVRIRERTDNARSLDTVLRAIGRTGATIETSWSIEQVLETGDRATGTTVLSDLYQRLALAPGTVDIDDLFRRLGVRRQGRGVAFDDGAPLAAVRRAITARDDGG